MSRKKFFFGVGIAVYVLPLLAIADPIWDSDNWNMNDVNKFGGGIAAKPNSNNEFFLKGTIYNDCKRENFSIDFDRESGVITISDPVPTKEEAARGITTVRKCMESKSSKGEHCTKYTCTKLSAMGGKFDFSGVERTFNLALNVSEESIVDVSPQLTHKSDQQLILERRQAKIDSLNAQVSSCTGEDRVKAARTLYAMGEGTLAAVDKAIQKATEDEFKALAATAKKVKADEADVDAAVDALLEFAQKNDTKWADRAVVACQEIGGKQQQLKTAEGFDKAKEIYEKCATIDGISATNTKRLKDYQLSLVSDKLKLSVSNPTLFMAGYNEAKELIQQMYDESCAIDGGDIGACASLQTLNDRVDGLYNNAQEMFQRTQMRRMQEQQLRAQRLSMPFGANTFGNSPFGMNSGISGLTPYGYNPGINQYGILGPQQYGVNGMYQNMGMSRF